jgi:hypothetical protein
VAREDFATGMTAHIDEDTLERRAMNRLPETEAAPVEEPLLVCHHCQDRLADIHSAWVPVQ